MLTTRFMTNLRSTAAYSRDDSLPSGDVDESLQLAVTTLQFGGHSVNGELGSAKSVVNPAGSVDNGESVLVSPRCTRVKLTPES